MTSYPIRNRHWTRKEYDQLITIGFFQEDEPIELLGGQLIVAEPKGTPHSTTIALTVEGVTSTSRSSALAPPSRRSRGLTSPSPWPICCRSPRPR